MAHDLWGNAISGEAPGLAEAIDAFAGGLVAYEARAVDILASAERFPAHPLVQAYAGVLHLLAEAKGAEEGARPFLARAEAALDAANPREQHMAAALARWIEGDIDGAIAILQALLVEVPRDLAALKLLHYHLFNRGDFPALLRSARASAEAAPELWPVHGMVAFGYEQLHLLDEAEQAAWRGLSLLPADPWAQHALAHVLLTQGRIDEGIAFLESARPNWTGLNSFMLTHLWWHLALFYLSAGRTEEALAAYEQVWGVAKDYSQDQVGAVSLLAQLELAGIDVGDRWDELAGWLVVRADDVVQPFLSAQYLYGLARAGRPEADTLLAAIEATANTDRQGSAVWRQAALPLAQGLVAHARGDFASAADRIEEALPRLIRLGGSHAQRDLFDQILLDARIRAGRLIEAQQTLELRRAHDPEGVPLNRRLAGVYRALGLDSEAETAEARVRERLAR
jgi:tetratricopeptide (TPR) repeat protein